MGLGQGGTFFLEPVAYKVKASTPVNCFDEAPKILIRHEDKGTLHDAADSPFEGLVSTKLWGK